MLSKDDEKEVKIISKNGLNIGVQCAPGYKKIFGPYSLYVVMEYIDQVDALEKLIIASVQNGIVSSEYSALINQ